MKSSTGLTAVLVILKSMILQQHIVEYFLTVQQVYAIHEGLLWIQQLGNVNITDITFQDDLLISHIRWFYWTDYGSDTIERASMDGSSRMILHNTGLSDTYAITIDIEYQVLYWADYTLNRIERSNVDGSNRVVLTTSIRDPFCMSYYNGRLYWGDISLNRVLNGPSNSPGSGSYLGGGVSYEVYGIQVISRDLQPLGENTNQELISCQIYLITQFQILAQMTMVTVLTFVS